VDVEDLGVVAVVTVVDAVTVAVVAADREGEGAKMRTRSGSP